MSRLIRIRPRAETLHISGDTSVFELDATGMIPPDSSYGFFVEQTRLLSLYRYLVNGRPPQPVVLSNIEQNSWRGYYVSHAPGAKPLNDQGSGLALVTGWLGGELVERLAIGVDEGAHENASSSLSERPAAQPEIAA